MNQPIRTRSEVIDRIIPALQHVEVHRRHIDDLKPNPRNARTHSRKQIRKIADSIKRLGFLNPVMIDETGTLLAGHGRIEAARLLGLQRVPCIQVEHLTEAQKRAYVIADNKLAQLADWDRDRLAVELIELGSLDIEIEATGFEVGEIDILIGEHHDKQEDPDDGFEDLPALDRDSAAITRPGDLWILGAHRLLCGSALEAEAYQRLFEGELADAVFTDPPYNVPIAGHVQARRNGTHPDFVQASGEMSSEAFTGFLSDASGLAVAASRSGAEHFCCMDWRHVSEAIAAGRQHYDALLNICVWDKGTGGMGSLYRSQHELVLVWRVPGASHCNNVELGRHGRNRTNVWRYKGLAGFGKDRDALLAQHPTIKPVTMVIDALRDVTAVGDRVLDQFVGSGTTLLAAEACGRVGHGIEIDPHYCDVAIHRWQQRTGRKAVLASTGEPFDIVSELRSGPSGSASGEHHGRCSPASDLPASGLLASDLLGSEDCSDA